jgi:peptidoglycan/xylan/chitin deacetylase (PgdA/CDA1 family)
MEDSVVALKIDVDTHQGMKAGVPSLLAILRDAGVQATFFLSFGPDNSGKAIWNILRKRGFLSKMIRTGAPRLYGFKTSLYGTVLPAPPIASAYPEIVRQIDQETHEIGVHAWDHRLWQDYLDRLSPEVIRQEFERSFAAYRAILGREPRAVAAPGWYCNQTSLELQDGLSLDYSSDTRGRQPFFPRMGGRVYRTLQIPTNQLCIEEMIGRVGIPRANLADHQITQLKRDLLNIVPIHAEIEGGSYCGHFREFLKGAMKRGFRFRPLQQLCRVAKEEGAPVRDVVLEEFPGRSGLVAVSS